VFSVQKISKLLVVDASNVVKRVVLNVDNCWIINVDKNTILLTSI